MLNSPDSPPVSWMLGPSEPVGSAGGGPWSSGIALTSSAFWSGIHCSALPSIGFKRTSPRRRVVPPTSPIHSSTASCEVLRNANRWPSAAQEKPSTQPPGGSGIGVSRPVATSTIDSVWTHGATP